MAISNKARESVYVRRFLNGLLSEQVLRKIKICCNNKTSFTLTRDPESQNCTKQLDVMYYYVKSLIEEGELGIKWVSSLSMLADGLTKALFAGFFKKH